MHRLEIRPSSDSSGLLVGVGLNMEKRERMLPPEGGRRLEANLLDSPCGPIT